jgi:hypothetical protein
MLYNFQTRALSMQFDPVALQNALRDSEQHPFALERQLESLMDGYEPGVSLRRAFEQLDRCCFVGLTERMEESLGDLSRALGATGAELRPAPVLNSATNQSDLSPLTREEYKELLNLISDDLALYEYARSISP